MFLVIGVLGIHGQTTETDTTLQAETIRINEQAVQRDTSNITENTGKATSLKEKDSLSLIETKKNPWLCDWRYGCLTDGLTYLIPMITLYHIVAPQMHLSYYPLDNCFTPCIYPIGLVFAEKIIKNIILTENRDLLKSENEIKIFAQTGFGLPYYATIFNRGQSLCQELDEFSHLINNIGINYISSLKAWNNNILVGLNFYSFPDEGSPVFFSTGLGLVINNYDVSVEKVILGKYKEIPPGVYRWFVENNYSIISDDKYYNVNYKFDFWGISLGWGKKYNIGKGFYVEPHLQYKFIYSMDFKSGSIVGIMGGLGIGFEFN